MADVSVAEAEAKAEAAFGMAFTDAPPAETPPAMVVEEAVPEPAKPVAVAPPAVVPEKPQYIRLTKQEWDNTKAAAGKVSSLESQLAKLTGQAPDAKAIAQQVLNEVRSQTPAGLDVEVSDDDFAELAADFPELAKSTRAALERILKKANVKGTGPAQSPTPSVDVSAEVEKVLTKREHESLARAYPDWSDIVGRPPAAGAPPSEGNEFRQWLAAQPAEYQKELNETNSPSEVKAAIDRFKSSSTTTQAASPARPDRAAARRAVIEDAITPRADGAPPPIAQREDAETAFGKAFKSAKRH